MVDLSVELEQHLDKDGAIELLRGAVQAHSITGNEANFVAYLSDKMHTLDLAPIIEEFAEGRPNIFGKKAGSGDDNNLLFVGHTDTVHVDGWREKWAGDERENPFSGALIDGEIWGRGTGDLKGGICTALAAMALIDAAGIKLKGDVSFAFVGDEESGEEGSGVSAGIDHLTKSPAFLENHKPDFAIYVEPTQLQVFPAQMGFFIADIHITGKSAYFGVPEQGVDALKAGHKVLSEIWTLSERMAMSANHDLVGNAFILVTEINGGGYIAVPGECKLSLICKILPGQTLNEAVRQLEHAIGLGIDGTGCRSSIQYPAGRDHKYGGTPTDIAPSLMPITQLSEILVGKTSLSGKVSGAPYWSEAPYLIERLGCPTVYCAPGNIANCHTLEERISVEEYTAGILAIAEFIVRYCGANEQH